MIVKGDAELHATNCCVLEDHTRPSALKMLFDEVSVQLIASGLVIASVEVIPQRTPSSGDQAIDRKSAPMPGDTSAQTTPSLL